MNYSSDAAKDKLEKDALLLYFIEGHLLNFSKVFYKLLETRGLTFLGKEIFGTGNEVAHLVGKIRKEDYFVRRGLIAGFIDIHLSTKELNLVDQQERKGDVKILVSKQIKLSGDGQRQLGEHVVTAQVVRLFLWDRTVDTEQRNL